MPEVSESWDLWWNLYDLEYQYSIHVWTFSLNPLSPIISYLLNEYKVLTYIHHTSSNLTTTSHNFWQWTHCTNIYSILRINSVGSRHLLTLRSHQFPIMLLSNGNPFIEFFSVYTEFYFEFQKSLRWYLRTHMQTLVYGCLN